MGDFPRPNLGLLAISLQKARFYSICALFLLLFGCAPEPAPELLEIDELVPPAVEVGTELRITGSGFPEHKGGKLILHGTAYSPARSPQGVTWQIPVRATTRGEAALRLDERTLSRLLGGAHHITFQGRAELVFAPTVANRPVLRGSLEGITLDLFGQGDGDPQAATAFAHYLGISLTPELVIDKLDPKSKAAQAGISVGDRLLTLDGVRLDGMNDFVPQPYSAVSQLSFNRDGITKPVEMPLERASFQILDLALSYRGVAAAAAICLALLFIAKPPRFFIWLAGPKSKLRRTHFVWLEGVKGSAQLLSSAAFVAIAVTFFWLLRTSTSAVSHFDFLLTFSVAALFVLVSAFILGGATSSGRFSLWGALSTVVISTVALIPVVIAIACRTSEVASLRLVELEALQGASPLRYGALDSPFSFLFACSYLVALLPIAGRRGPLEAGVSPRSLSMTVGRFLEWTGHLTLVALWVTLFFAGTLGPWSSSLALSGIVFSLKMAAVVHTLCHVRARLGHVRLSEAWALFSRSNLLLAVCCALLFGSNWALGLSRFHLEIYWVFGVTLAAALLILSIIGKTRSWMQVGRRGDPWI